jgi:hypothetical protein
MSLMKSKVAKRERVPNSKALWQLAIDKDLRRRFKARCVEASTTMSEKVEELVRAWLEKKS